MGRASLPGAAVGWPGARPMRAGTFGGPPVTFGNAPGAPDPFAGHRAALAFAPACAHAVWALGPPRALAWAAACAAGMLGGACAVERQH